MPDGTYAFSAHLVGRAVLNTSPINDYPHEMINFHQVIYAHESQDFLLCHVMSEHT